MKTYQLSAKHTMHQLLLTEALDDFLFIEGEITTFNTFTIDGFLKKEFFDEPPASAYSRWQDVRRFCLEVIRGKRTPVGFRIVLSLSPEEFPDVLAQCGLTSQRPEEIAGLYLNFRYDGSALVCVTGVSLQSFSLDKSLEKQWDDYALGLLKSWQMEPEA